MYTYRQILKQAFKIAWKKPELWLFGFFLAFMGTAGEFEVFLGSLGTGPEGVFTSFFEGLAAGGFFTVAGFQGLASNLVSSPFLLLVSIFFLLLFFGVLVLGVWLLMVSQGALIGQSIAASKDKETHLNEGFALGVSKFWPVLGVNVFFRIATAILLSLTFLLSLMNFPGSALLFIILSGAVLIVAAIVSFIARYAICGIVLRDWNLKQSLSNSWQLFKANWLLSIEISLMLLFIYVVVNVSLFFWIGLVLVAALDFFGGFAFGLILILLGVFATIVAVQVLMSVFYWSAWALVFEIIASRKELLKSFLKRSIEKIF